VGENFVEFCILLILKNDLVAYLISLFPRHGLREGKATLRTSATATRYKSKTYSKRMNTSIRMMTLKVGFYFAMYFGHSETEIER